MRDQMIADPINQALFDVAPVSDETWRTTLSDDLLYSVFYHAKKVEMAAFIGREYGLPSDVVEKLQSYDLQTWKGALTSGKAARFESFRKRSTDRLSVFSKNRDVLHQLMQIADFGRIGYLDVGCGHGFTMLAAQSLGFEKAHGVEVDRQFFQLGKQFFPNGLDADIGYADDDFLALPVSTQYSLITFFDVLEHIADYDLALKKALSLSTDKGLVYAYQGNQNGIQMVRYEPHYKVPMINQLPRDMAINILLRLNKITSPEKYVISEWPPFSVFEREDCYSALVRGPINLRNGGSYLTMEQGDSYLRALAKEYPVVLGPVLSDKEMSVVDKAYGDYARRYEEAKSNPHLHERNFLMNSWNILLAKDKRVLRDATRLEVLSMPRDRRSGRRRINQ
jgi:2-polyprenyl-3-methyl-5-hydroxy-6-metoxy-1,4-benzoquinol methylase